MSHTPTYTHIANIRVYHGDKLFAQSLSRPAMSVEHAQTIMRNMHSSFPVMPRVTRMAIRDNEGREVERTFEITGRRKVVETTAIDHPEDAHSRDEVNADDPSDRAEAEYDADLASLR